MPPDQTAACHYCGRSEWPYCMNSRDMEDMAINGVDRCFKALEANGWGEAGERYVRLNREKNRTVDTGRVCEGCRGAFSNNTPGWHVDSEGVELCPECADY